MAKNEKATPEVRTNVVLTDDTRKTIKSYLGKLKKDEVYIAHFTEDQILVIKNSRDYKSMAISVFTPKGRSFSYAGTMPYVPEEVQWSKMKDTVISDLGLKGIISK